uniref:Uncharacterized protein n=1 Tax=Romanomermis culicivorax TaxID=13658 RepID=A0A915HLS9_ROMCU
MLQIARDEKDYDHHGQVEPACLKKQGARDKTLENESFYFSTSSRDHLNSIAKKRSSLIISRGGT